MAKNTRWSEVDLKVVNDRIERVRKRELRNKVIEARPKPKKVTEKQRRKTFKESMDELVMKAKITSITESNIITNIPVGIFVEVKVLVAPLSVNAAFQGRRYKTPTYKEFEKKSLMRMPLFKLPNPPFKIEYEFGFSSKLSDLGNPEKLCTDTLCMKYGFDDRDIYEINLKKVIVPKGQEYWKFKITHLGK